MRKLSLLTLVFVVFGAACVHAEVCVKRGAAPGKALRLACDRLEIYIEPSASGTIKLKRIDDAETGDEGYRIQTEKPNVICVTASTKDGLANGVYTLLRTLMIEDLDDPFARAWNVCEQPAFRWRAMMVAPYSFGFAHNFSVLSPDMWAFKHWKQYLDYLRLFNMNKVGIYPMRKYDPAIPETWPNKERYAIWKQAMDYAHDLGMEFFVVQTANGVPQELWWKNPELRCGHESGWVGCALCYSKARDIIRATQQHTYEYFKDADYFMFMYSDGGGACYCDQCSEDHVAVFMQILNDTRETLSDIGSDADIIFWNWLLPTWYETMGAGIPGYLETYPQVRNIQENVFERVPRDVIFEDIGTNPINAQYPHTLTIAKERGFKTTVDFLYYMNPELPWYIFPRPQIFENKENIQRSRAMGADGVDGYRLSPNTRILSDFAMMRLAWDPDLAPEALIDEMAGYLTTREENRAKVAEAIGYLELNGGFLGTLENLERASALLDEAKTSEPSWQLEYITDMVSLMPYVFKLNQPDITPEQAAAAKTAMFNETRRRYILQGFGSTDHQWLAESFYILNAWANIWSPNRFTDLPTPQTVLNP